MSINRTANPIAQKLGKILEDYSAQRKQEFSAVLGNGINEVSVSPNPDNNGNGHYGYYWIRLASGNNNSGTTQYGEPQKAQVDKLLHIPETQNLPIRVTRSGRNNEWVITGIDNKNLIAADVNPNSYNLFRLLNSLYARMLRDGRIFISNQLNSSGTKYTIESYVGLWDGDRQFYEHGRGLSDNLDLASYIPTADNERLVLIAYLPYENLYQVVAGATRSIDSSNFTLSYLNDMAEQLLDYAMAKGCVRLQNAQTTITIEDFRIDLRQWFQAHRPRGFPSFIAVPRTIIGNHQQIYYGSLTNDNLLKNDGLIVQYTDEPNSSGGGSGISLPLSIADGGTAATTASGARTNLGLAIGTDVQAWDADLDGLAAVSSTGLINRTGAGTFSTKIAPSGTVVGTSDSQTLTNKTIDGASNTISNINLASQVTGVTPIANGGTNANNTTSARTNLGLAIGSDVQAWDTDLDAIAGLSTTGLVNRTGSGTANTKTAPTGDVVGTTDSQTLTNKTINGANNTISNINLASQVTGTLPIANGGTGQTGQTSAFDALAPTTTNGDLIYYNGTDNVRLAIGSSGQLLGVSGGIPAWINPLKFAILSDEKTSGTNGGASSAATWNNRDVNTENYDPDNIVSISSNQFTPISGDYEIDVYAASGASASGGAQKLRLYNVTGATTVKDGLNISNPSGNPRSPAHLTCKFTANGTDAYRIDHYTVVAQTTNGLGAAMSLGTEVYMVIKLTKVA